MCNTINAIRNDKKKNEGKEEYVDSVYEPLFPFFLVTLCFSLIFNLLKKLDLTIEYERNHEIKEQRINEEYEKVREEVCEWQS